MKIQDLYEDIFIEILHYLTIKDLIRLFLTSKIFNKSINFNLFKKKLEKYRFITNIVKLNKQFYKKIWFLGQILQNISSNESKLLFQSRGRSHGAFVTLKGTLFTVGSGRQGQLGNCRCARHPPSRINVGRNSTTHHHPCNRESVLPVQFPYKVKIVYVSCGDSHTVCLSYSGKAFSFGNAANGRLGHSTNIDPFWNCCFKPTIININKKIYSIHASLQNTFLITTEEELFVSFKNLNSFGLKCIIFREEKSLKQIKWSFSQLNLSTVIIYRNNYPYFYDSVKQIVI